MPRLTRFRTLLLAAGLLLWPVAVRAGLGTGDSGAAVIDSRPPDVVLDSLGEHFLMNAGQTLDFHWTHSEDNPGVNLASFWARMVVDGEILSSVSWFPGPDEYTWSWTAPEIQTTDCHVQVVARDAFGNESHTRSETFTVLYSTTDAPPDAPLLQVAGPAPNPFNPACRVDLRLGADARLTVAVFDARGRRVRTLRQGPAAAGPLSVAWRGLDDKGRPQPGGLYLFLIEVESAAGARRELRKAVLLP